MLTATQIAAIIMLLNAFRVPADVVAQIQYDITPQATTTEQVATTPTIDTTTNSNPVVVSSAPTIIYEPATIPLKVPACNLSSKETNIAGISAIVVTMNQNASGYSLDNGEPLQRSQYDPGRFETPYFSLSATTTVTLTENMSAQAGFGDYEPVTTCSITLIPTPSPIIWSPPLQATTITSI